jgi:hypothetical protein
MDKVARVQVLLELFELINMYYEERDMPNEENDFFIKVENYCKLLDLDFSEFKKKFGLNFVL